MGKERNKNGKERNKDGKNGLKMEKERKRKD